MEVVAADTRTSALLLLAAKVRVDLRAAGDVAGHEFHGNQWSEGTVLGKSGTPLTLFHGSTAKGMTTQTLDPNATRVRPATTPTGVAFTSDERQAAGYARMPGKASEGGNKFGSVVKANLVMNNPLDITKDVKAGQKAGKTFGDAKREALTKLTPAHDGMIFRGDRYNSDEYVVFSKEQIREPHSARSLSANSDNTHVHRAADAHYDKMLLVVSAAFMRGKKAYKLDGIDAAVKAIHASLKATLPSVLLTVMKMSGASALKMLPRARAAKTFTTEKGLTRKEAIARARKLTKKDFRAVKYDAKTGELKVLSAIINIASFRALAPQRVGQPHDTKGDFGLAFNVSDPNAVAWAENHAAELADGISETSRERIQNAVARAVDGDGIDAAYDDILDAIGDEARADMIVRTEVMDAANEGLAQSWDQAQEAGLLPDNATKVWIAADGCCDECDAVDGEEVPLDEDFSAGDDPPLHPNCRCTMGIGTGAA